MKNGLVMRALDELIDVLRYHCLDLGCQHVRAELYLSTGTLLNERIPDTSRRCNNMCPICNNTWKLTFLPMVKTKVEKFVKLLDRKYLPLEADKDNLVDILWKEEKSRVEGIFGKKSVTKFNIGGLFLQLIANGIIILKKKQCGMHLEWRVKEIADPDSSDDDYILASEIDSNWIGINIRL